MKLAIVHYHFERGGVTRVVQNAMDALSLHCKEDIEICLLSGRPLNKELFPVSSCIPSLDYSNNFEISDPSDLVQLLEEEARILLGGVPDVWHIHNHSLGKNNSMVDVVHLLAQKGVRMLLQIHDYAEDGRPSNYKRIIETSSDISKLYPYASNIQYAVLNQRDYQFLNLSGIEESYIHLLPNPVSVESQHVEPWNESMFHPSLQNKERVLYPVRMVRRKNIGEMLLLSMLDKKKRLYINTLPPTNPDVMPLYNRWKRVIEDLNIHAILGAAEQFSGTFDQIVDASSGVISTSIAEGFGLGFLEPWLMNKAVSGRNLPEITTDFSEKGILLKNFYENIFVPLEWVGADRLLNHIKKAIENYYDSYQKDLPVNAVQTAYENAVSDDRVEFSRLNEAMQESVLEKLAELTVDERMEHCSLDVNLEFDESLIDWNKSKINEGFSLKQYGTHLGLLYEGLDSVSKGLKYGNPSRLLDCFMDPKRFYLLRSE